MDNTADGHWKLEIMSTWLTYLYLNVISYNKYFYGDIDSDSILVHLLPNPVAPNYLNISARRTCISRGHWL